MQRRSLAFPGLSRPVVLDGADEVAQGLSVVLKGWHPARQPFAARDRAVVSHVRVAARGFDISSPYLDDPMCGLTVTSAVCGVIADLAQGFIEDHPECMALHCGAVTIGGRTIVLTGAARAGKSTLMARLTAEQDMMVICDDVLPIMPDDRAFGLGIAPRLRLPLPAGASAQFEAALAASDGPRDTRYAYVTADNIAPHGTRADLSALVVMARDAESSAALHRMDRAEAVAHLVRRNMSVPEDAVAHLDRVNRLAEKMCCLKLVYSDLEEAVQLLRAAFGQAQFPAPDVPVGPALSLDPDLGDDSRLEKALPADLAAVWIRTPGVALRRIREHAFLWNPADGSYFHVNPVAAAVWTLLETPQTGEAVLHVLCKAFPAVRPDQIGADLEQLLAVLRAEMLVDSTPP